MNGLHILVLEDNLGHRVLLETKLLALQQVKKVILATNIEEAFQIIQSDFINAIITDHRLENETTGLDFLRLIRESGHRIPSVILSGVEHEVNEKEAQKYGCIAVLGKVFVYDDTNTLIEAIEKLADRAIYRSFEILGGSYVPITTDGTIIMVPVKEVIYIGTKYGGTRIYTESEWYSTDTNIKKYQNYLYDSWFRRFARGNVINLSKVESFDGKFIYMKANIHDFTKFKVVEKDFVDGWKRFLSIKNL
ncbi:MULTISPECIES: response regulator transcription factor [Brevibacillus]|uniref:Response regulator n=1 Tax=Brevibacillus brevis TaxID=1393 RepID=A0A517IGH5_BREBE|nr:MULTISPECIES: response regulator transcription factor [Brevibacillus]NRS51943.1 response regulator transcription factor [Brevibacillus sp. HB2.2]QDS37991.1 response regulator [Brevibacillus brevis]